MSDESNKTTTTSLEPVLCSVCLEAVSDNAGRSTAKLGCGHRFHLDCIGSAFNIKGAMQCPNCRKVERGRWLLASAPTRSRPEISTEDWTVHEDQYGLSYPEIPFNIHWCPFSGLARVHSAFEALESSPPAYHNLHRHPNMFAEHGAASSVSHSYVANFRPASASSTTNEPIEDPNFSYHWNGVSNPHVFPVADMHYHNGVHHSHMLPAHSAHPNSTDVAPVTLRSTRGSYMHPFLFGHGSRLHERLQPSHTIHRHHQPTNPLGMPTAMIPNMARFHGRRALPPPLPVPANSVSNRNGGFFMVPPRGSSVQDSHEPPANPVPDRNGGFFIVPPRGSSVQNSHEAPANSVPDHNGGFFIVPPRGSSVQNLNEMENSLPSEPNRTRNFWNGHWS